MNRASVFSFTFANDVLGASKVQTIGGSISNSQLRVDHRNANSFSTQEGVKNSDHHHHHQPVTSKKPSVRVGVIGCGRIGRLHSKTVHESNGLGQLIWISDTDSINGTKLALETNTQFLCNSKLNDALLSVRDDPYYVDAVIICTPNSTHAHYVNLSLDHYKHVMCEKPMTTDPRQMQTIFKLAEDRNRKLLIGFQRVFDADIARLIKQARQTSEQNNEDPMSISMRCYDSPLSPSYYLRQVEPIVYHTFVVLFFICLLFRTCGSIFADAMCHDIHVSSSLLKPDVELHSAVAKEAPFPDASLGARSASVLFTTNNGTFITIEFHRVSQIGYDNTIDVTFWKKMYRLQSRPRFALTEAKGDGLLYSSDYDDSFITKYFGAYRNEVHQFLESIRDDGAFDHEHMRQCVRAMWMVKLAEDASKSGKEIFFKNY
eukprot:g3944.t1